ncbi:Fe(3+)-dicitrate ABC transporter ATP-binding protein [Marinococcus halophilus]|uniref:Iron-dicitrate ABC transporter ATP-binding protein n=1 Tax=Marinococcus halophilus TaxID=1371 RepID=A0A510Y6B3_MARHA|nr:ABC transporter ATP-binding protein [Marinococcus halophilus]OZT79877.1 Fe(3+)-dicitrate ABC transporter ATP-binding protein [Marinococcus halophilus]GEK58703.1 iron-dicitrate ABC transporter ATP-binding protein [Marinococcus halophilus]
MIETDQLHIGYDQQTIVNDLNIEIHSGKITALVGANGSGKSTILKALSRLMKPSKGVVYLNGSSIHSQKTKELAKQMAILPQNPEAPQGLTVTELVTYGRAPHQRGFGSLKAHDKEMIGWAIEITGMREFANRPIDHLSGGQRQRAWIAMALAQETETLFLDEPTTFLDMAHQMEVLNILEKLNVQEHRTIVMVVHDLNHASRYAHHIVAIKHGNVVKTGTPHEVMEAGIIEKVFGIKSDIIKDPRSGMPLCLPYNLCEEQAASPIFGS